MFQLLTNTQAGCRRSFPRRLSCRTTTLATLSLIAFLSYFFYPQPASAASGERPNIIFIMADDLGYGELGCYGQQKIKTPHIDRLAAEGMRFTQAYAGSHVCQPSRSVLMTGLHTGHTPVRANDVKQMLYDQDITVAEVLKSRGYATGAFGKWGLGFEGTSGRPLQQGFDEFFGQLLQVHAHFYHPYWIWKNETKYMLPGNEKNQRKQYVHDEIHAQALDFIRRNHDHPFFAYLPYIIPHVELIVPEESEIPYRGKFPRRVIQDPRPGYIGSDDGLTTFAAMISRLDRHVGEIMQLLKDLHIDDNTIVIFTSDNGGQNGGKNRGWEKMTDFFHGNGPLRGYKGQFYEGGIRVPLIARWPGHIPADVQSDHILAFWDVLPTLADLAGATAPKNIDGLSFAPTLLRQPGQKEHEFMYWEYARRGGLSRAARSGRWKVVQNGPRANVELYDLKTDLGEAKNIAADHPDIVARLSSYMDAAHQPPRDFPPQQRRTGVKDYVR